MSKKLNLIFLSVLLSLLSLGCKPDKKPIVLATYTYATNNRIANLKPLAQNLEKRLQRNVETKSYPDVESFVKGIKSDKVDIALINTLGYLILAPDNQHMLPVANLHVKKDAVDNYKTVFLTSNDSLRNYSAIPNKADQLTMMFVKTGSTSGNLIPRLFLSSINITSPESQFKEVKYGGNHTSTLERLVNGEADLGALGSNEYYKQIKADSTLKNKVKLLWVSDEIPLGPVLVNKKMSSEEKETISQLLLSLHTKNVEAFEAIKAGWSEAKQADKFQRISDKYYDSFREVNGSKTRLNDILKMLGK
ncbi:MAG TPA: hypothetical protein DCS93_01020 [Microscillaceae bacterium]|nr:hypothetical protein [Microscillaceae bacterium]